MSLLQDIIQTTPKVEPKVETPEQPKESLIREFTSNQTALKSSDATDAGKSDVIDKALANSDVQFSLMRNTINSDGGVTGSDVSDYIERAEDLNDEVDTVPFGLETDDGQIVKVYVNAEQADAFEGAMKNMLGMEDDIEAAINRLTTEFDIVDVVWPSGGDEGEGEEGAEEDPDADLTIDNAADDDFSDESDDDFADDQYDVIAAADDKTDDTTDDSSDDGDADNDGDSADDDNDDEEELDDNGKPKKKKKKAQPAEPSEDETTKQESLNMTIGSSFLQRVLNEAPAADVNQFKKFKRLADAYSLAILNSGDKTPAAALAAEKKIRAMDNGDALMKIAKKAHDTYMNLAGPAHSVGGSIDPTDMKKVDAIIQKAAGLMVTAKPTKVTEDAVDPSPNTAQDQDGVKDGFNIPLDSQQRALTGKLKLPWAKRLIAFHAMCGIPGRYLNNEEAEGSIMGAADMLRKKVSVRRAFLDFYDAFATAKGYTIPASEPTVTAEGIMEASVKKRGSYLQKLLESVMIELGLPPALVANTGPSAVGTAIYRTAEMLEQSSDLERMIRTLAARLGIKPTDVGADVDDERGGAPEEDESVTEAKNHLGEPEQTTFAGWKRACKQLDPKVWFEGDKDICEAFVGPNPYKRGETKSIGQWDGDKGSIYKDKVTEAVDLGSDDPYVTAVSNLMSQLGVPDVVLNSRRAAVVQGLLAQKRAVRASTVMTAIGKLSNVITANKIQTPSTQQNTQQGQQNNQQQGQANEAASRWKFLSALKD